MELEKEKIKGLRSERKELTSKNKKGDSVVAQL